MRNETIRMIKGWQNPVRRDKHEPKGKKKKGGGQKHPGAQQGEGGATGTFLPGRPQVKNKLTILTGQEEWSHRTLDQQQKNLGEELI